MKFPAPQVNQSKIVGADLRVYFMSISGTSPYNIKVGVNDMDNDPEDATDAALWSDTASSNIFDGGTAWEPTAYGNWYTVPLQDSDYYTKNSLHGDWYGVGMMKISGNYNYLYLGSHVYSGYEPELLIKHKVPFGLEVDIANADPVLDTSGMTITPSTVDEGDTVKVSGITYTDLGKCDSHSYRVIKEIEGEDPVVVVDWTAVSGGKLEFEFEATDDDPEDADMDISKDDVTLKIELKDDDYHPPGGDFMIVPPAATSPNTGGNTIPWGPGFGMHRYQQYYGAAILGGEAKEFSGWGFRYYQSSTWSITYYNLKIYLSHKSTTGLSSTFSSNYGTDRTLVLSRSSYTWVKDKTGQDFTMMSFDTPFKYDGTSNMVMEVSYTSGSPNSNYYFNTYSTSDMWRLYATSPTATTGTVGSSYGLVTAFEFDPTPESGIDNATFDITVHNVDPTIDTSGMKILDEEGNEVSGVLEGETCYLSNITIEDPALDVETEIFEYRIDWKNGTKSPWTTFTARTGGETTVVPNNREDSEGNSNNVFPWSPQYGYRRYMQWYDKSQFTGGGAIVGVGFRPDSMALSYSWKVTYNDLKVYMIHTTATSLSTTFANNYGSQRTLVFSGDVSWEKTSSDMEWKTIDFDRKFNYNGGHLIAEFQYDSATYSGNSIIMDFESGMTLMHRMGGSSPTATTGTVWSNSGLVTQFTFAPPGEEYAAIPDIPVLFLDDHPETGTSSDDIPFGIEVRDDDGGYDEADAEFTVENVAPKVLPGTIYIDGVKVGDAGDPIIVPNAATTPSGGGNTIPWGPAYGTRRYMQYYHSSQFGGTPRKFSGIGFRYGYTDTFSITYYNLKIYMSHKSTTGLSSTFANNYGTDRTLVLDRSSYTWTKTSTVQDFTMIDFDTKFNYDGTSHVVIEVVYTSGTPSSYYYFNTYSTSYLARLWASSPTATTGSTSSSYGLVTMFVSAADYDLEMDEGQMITLEDWDIDDPAEEAPTEYIHYEIDWGDGEWSPLFNNTGLEGINMKPSTGDNVIVPNGYGLTNQGNSDNTIPWGPGFGTRRYMQWYDDTHMGGSARKIDSVSFLYRRGTLPTITYNNIKIYMSHLKSESLSTTFANNYGTDRTLVFSKTSWSWSKTSSANAFMKIPFDNSFKYNGKDNVVMEVVYTSGSPSSTYYWNAVSNTNAMRRIWASSPTATTGSTDTSYGYGLITMFGFEPITLPPSPWPWQTYSHRYRDDPAAGDNYTMTIHMYDDDLGHGTYSMVIKVNNIDPVIDPRYVMPAIVGQESGSPSVLLPQVPFDDPATQYDLSDPNEEWTYWWDIDNNGVMNNAPDVIGTVDQSDMTEVLNHSYGKTPAVKTTVNDDYLQRPIALYIFDDDMTHDLSSDPTSATGTITITNVAPQASIEVYIPVELRVRMSGTQENDVTVGIRQKGPRDTIVDSYTIERMPGQPKDNPFADGAPSAPLFVKLDPSRTAELFVTFDATADSNDVHTDSGPNGADPVWVYLDFPEEDDYDPRDDDQSSTGHHWAQEFKFNVQQDGPIATETVDITSEMQNKKAYLVGISYDDASDDAQFNWFGASAPLTHTQITYYNDGADPEIPGSFTDTYPSPWDGTAPVTYKDIHVFLYSTGFTVSLYTVDDDGGVSNTATLVVL
jgi:hypothetical protein